MPPDTLAVAVPRPRPVDETEIDTDSRENLALEHAAVVPPQLPLHSHFDWVVVSATSRSLPEEQPFKTALLQLPLVAGVTVHVALVALPQVPALHANVADPLRHDSVVVKVTLEPERVVLALAEQPPLHASVVPEHGGFWLWQ